MSWLFCKLPFEIIKNNKNMKGYIYTITNTINHKVYVGQSIDYKKRWKQHISRAKTDSGKSHKLYNAMNKYGVEMFDFLVIAEVYAFTVYDLKTRLNELERYYIDYYNSIDYGYNLTKGGDAIVNTPDTIYAVANGRSKKNKLDLFDRQYERFPYRYTGEASQPGFIDIYEANLLNEFTEIEFWPNY